MSTYVKIHEETCTDYGPGEWNLCFQWCTYHYDNGSPQDGYRFIWRRENGNLQPARGQARIPSIALIEELIKVAKDKGWGELNDLD